MTTNRTLATILFTDIVASTERATELRDESWGELRRKHDAVVRRELRRFSGREVKTTGDGFLAVFARPAQGLAAAAAIRDGVRSLGLDIRAGLHMGEVDTSRTDVTGIVVHVAARVMALAAPGEILVSTAVRDALGGSLFEFKDRGVHELRGVPDEWRVYAVAAVPELERERGTPRRLALRLEGKPILIGSAAFLGLCLFAGLYVALGERGSNGKAREGEVLTGAASRLAVLPFRVVGPERELWSEGMVELLSTSLDGAAGLRTVEPRSIFARLGESEKASTATTVEAVDVGRELGAAVAVTGSIVTLGSEVRLTASIYDCRTGELEEKVQVRGAPDSLPRLVDELSVRILRDALAKRTPGLAADRLRGVTTSDVEALRAYLRGEQAFRRARIEEAIPHFMRAVEADSAFAMALYRLSLAKSWSVSPHIPTPNEYEEAALRYGGRLGKREQTLLRSHYDLNRTYLSSIDSLERLTERYPDDPEAWFLLGDAYFHQGPRGLYPRDNFRTALRRSLQLDPNFGLALVHLTQDAFHRRDSIEARSLVLRLRNIDPQSSEAIGFALAYTYAFGNSRDRAAADEARERKPTLALMIAKHTLDTVPEYTDQARRIAIGIAEDPRHPMSDRASAWIGVWNVEILQGRLARADSVARRVESILRDHPSIWPGASGWVLDLPLWLFASGYETKAATIAADRQQRNPSSDPFPLGVFAARQGQADHLNRQIQRLEEKASDSTEVPDRGQRLANAISALGLRGFGALMSGDSADAVSTFEHAIDMSRKAPDWWDWDILRFEVAKLYLARGRAEDARRYFHSFYPADDKELTIPVEFYLGRTYEAMREPDSARVHYERVVQTWRDADRELQPMVQEARAAVQRFAILPRE